MVPNFYSVILQSDVVCVYSDTNELQKLYQVFPFGKYEKVKYYMNVI